MYTNSCYHGIYEACLNCRNTYEQKNLAMALQRNAETQNFAMKMINLQNKVNSSIGGYKQLCRFCLAGASKPINQRNMESFKILTNSTLVSAPEYPKAICSLCEAQLHSASKFRLSLVDMERCWAEFFQNDFRQFVRSIDISEEHIYDEIFLEIELDARDDDPSSMRSIDHRSSAPLIDPNEQESFIKTSFVGLPRSIQTLTLAETIESERTAHHNDKYYQSSHYTKITQTAPFAQRQNSHGLSDFSRQFLSISEDKICASYLTKRNHDIVSLSYESINKRSHTEYNLHDTAEVSEAQIKCVVVGDAAVGKTNLILSYLKNKFDNQHIPTASDIYTFDVDVNTRLVQVVLCDTAGQDSFDDLRKLSYPGCHVFLLCFSVVKPDSFHAIKRKWAPKFRNTKASLILVGTQLDLRSDRQTIMNLQQKRLRPVSISDAQKLAKSIRATYIETSSCNNEGVKKTFDTAIEIALKKIDPTDFHEETWCYKNWAICCVG